MCPDKGKSCQIKTRQFMWQMAFLHDHAAKRLEAYFAPAIMAEKRQELSQRTSLIGIYIFFSRSNSSAFCSAGMMISS
jgi:hypothetical protein